MKIQFSEAPILRCSWKKVFWKYVANLQWNTHADVISIKLQSNFIEIKLQHESSPLNFSGHPFLRTHLDGYFWVFNNGFPPSAFVDIFLSFEICSTKLSTVPNSINRRINLVVKKIRQNFINLFKWALFYMIHYQ